MHDGFGWVCKRPGPQQAVSIFTFIASEGSLTPAGLKDQVHPARVSVRIGNEAAGLCHPWPRRKSSRTKKSVQSQLRGEVCPISGPRLNFTVEGPAQEAPEHCCSDSLIRVQGPGGPEHSGALLPTRSTGPQTRRGRESGPAFLASYESTGWGRGGGSPL